MSQRALQIAEVLRRELNNFLIKETEVPKDCLLTITQVELTADLETAWISLSVLPISQTGRATSFFKKILPSASRFAARSLSLRKMPKLQLIVDDYALKHRAVEKALAENK